MVGAVEYVVGGYVYDFGSVGVGGHGEILDRVGVDGGAEHLLFLCAVYGGVGGAVHDMGYLVVGHVGVDGLGVGEVEFLHVGVESLAGKFAFENFVQLGSELAIGSGYECLHIKERWDSLERR